MLMTMSDLTRELQISVSSVNRLRRKQLMPAPFTIPGNAKKLWHRHQIEAWLAGMSETKTATGFIARISDFAG